MATGPSLRGKNTIFPCELLHLLIISTCAPYDTPCDLMQEMLVQNMQNSCFEFTTKKSELVSDILGNRVFLKWKNGEEKTCPS